MDANEVKKAVPLGQTVITAAAAGTLNPEDVRRALARHARGDWGECSKNDAE